MQLTQEQLAGLCKGYLLPSPAKDDFDARYCPVLNQIWTFGKFPGASFEHVYSHEFIHVYMTSLQPPRLVLLNSIFQNKHVPSECFEEIVETACELYYQIQINMPDIACIKAYCKSARFPEMYSILADIWLRTLANADTAISREVAMEAAIRGLSIFLMHIVTKYPGTGLVVLKALYDIDPPIKWQKSQEIWSFFYKKLDEKIWANKDLQKQFHLAFPMGVHRSIADAIHFTASAIEMVRHDPYIVKAIFPTLLELLTQGSFVLLPVINIKENKKRFIAEIKLIHTTYRTPRVPDRLAIALKSQASELEKKQTHCLMASFFVSLVEQSKSFRISNSQDRTYKCYMNLLQTLANLLEINLDKTTHCSGCMLLLRDKYFQNICKNILNMSSSTLKNMIEIAKDYENFLLHDTTKLIRDDKGWNISIRTLKAYNFL